MKHARKTLAAVALFGLAPLVGCDQGGVEDATTPERPPETTQPDTTQPPPDRAPPPAEPIDPEPTDPGGGGIEDPSGG